jgi:signal transduction histidine kinase
MSNSLREAHKEIRIFSYLMRPPDLRRQGLEKTTERLVSGFGVRSGLHSTCTIQGDVESASAAAQHAVFRVIQEALSNVHRHAHADSVGLQLTEHAGVLTVCVSDDGKGIARLRAGDADEAWIGVGVTNMRARVEEIGGSFDMVCGAVGTRVFARIPSAGPVAWTSALASIWDADA